MLMGALVWALKYKYYFSNIIWDLLEAHEEKFGNKSIHFSSLCHILNTHNINQIYR